MLKNPNLTDGPRSAELTESFSTSAKFAGEAFVRLTDVSRAETIEDRLPLRKLGCAVAAFTLWPALKY